MSENGKRPNLTVIEGGLSGKKDDHQVRSSTGIREGNHGMAWERPGFTAGIRKRLGIIAEKITSPKENSKAGFRKGF